MADCNICGQYMSSEDIIRLSLRCNASGQTSIQGGLLNGFEPTNVASSFNVDTISGIINWTNNAGATAQHEIYRATNGGAETLIGTTLAGATSYTDAGCKQNASVVYRVRAVKDGHYSDHVPIAALLTPLCLKTDQSVLTPFVISLNIAVGKSVTINWGDGTSINLSGNNTNVTKNYSSTGQYNISISGDINSITFFIHRSQIKTYGNISNWILPTPTHFYLYATSVTGNLSSWVLTRISDFRIHTNLLSGNIGNWIVPNTMNYFYVYSNNFTGSLPLIEADSVGLFLNYQAQSCSFSNSLITNFRKYMTNFNIGNQNVPFVTANIDKLLKDAADYYQINTPLTNCTFSMNSNTNMGIPTGGANNADLLRLVGYYTAAGMSCTVVVRTS